MMKQFIADIIATWYMRKQFSKFNKQMNSEIQKRDQADKNKESHRS